MALSREFRLLLECCHWNFARPAGAPLDQVSPDVDWSNFLRLARFHRVQGLASRALSTGSAAVPAEIADALASDAEAIARANLEAAVECRDLAAAFAEAGIALLFVKGLTLAVLAYGNAWTKAAVDIDILVPDDTLEATADLLRSRGYELATSNRERSSLEVTHRLRKESAWVHKSRGIQLDLHTRLADHPQMIAAVGLESRRQLVKVAEGVELPTLANDPLFAYLAVHGASSAWFRLKWIADLAALLAPLPGAAIEQLYARSQALGAGRAAVQALLLADMLFGTLAEAPGLKNQIQADRAGKWLASVAYKLVSAPDPVEPTSVRWGTLPIHYTQLLLLPGISFKLSELARQARAALG
jgi:hypothetical protein